MIDMRELEAFEANVQADDDVRRMLEAITRDAAGEAQPEAVTRADPVLGLWIVGLAGLWLLLKVGINHLRGMSDAEILDQQIDKIAKLKELGYDEKQAAAVVQRLLKSIRTRPDDDSVLSALKKLLT